MIVLQEGFFNNILPNLKPNEVSVFLAIVGFFGGGESKFPKYTEIARVANCSERTVSIVIKNLVTRGLISVGKPRDKDGTFLGNEYRINTTVVSRIAPIYETSLYEKAQPKEADLKMQEAADQDAKWQKKGNIQNPEIDRLFTAQQAKKPAEYPTESEIWRNLLTQWSDAYKGSHYHDHYLVYLQEYDKNPKNLKRLTYPQFELFARVIDYLNARTNKKHKYTNTEAIKACYNYLGGPFMLRSGTYKFDMQPYENFIRIIDAKARDKFFVENPKYMRAVTLFCQKHFETYLEEALEWEAANKKTLNTPPIDRSKMDKYGRLL